MCKGNDNTDDNVSLKETYMFVEKSVKGSLHKLLYTLCPGRVRDPDDFAHRTPSSNTCMATAVHESCSRHILHPSHALDETVDLLRDLVVNQEMETVLPVVDAENEVGLTSRDKDPGAFNEPPGDGCLS